LREKETLPSSASHHRLLKKAIRNRGGEKTKTNGNVSHSRQKCSKPKLLLARGKELDEPATEKERKEFAGNDTSSEKGEEG